jgi:hypothetical protein
MDERLLEQVEIANGKPESFCEGRRRPHRSRRRAVSGWDAAR